MNPSSSISDGDSDAFVGGGQASEDPDKDQETHIALSGKKIFYQCISFSVGLNIKAINVLYAADEDLGLPELGSAASLFTV